MAGVLSLPFVLCFAADSRRYGRVALRVLYEPITSMSMTVLKAFGERPRMGARKLPAAPALSSISFVLVIYYPNSSSTYMQKSRLPSSFTHRSAASWRSCAFLTSTAPRPRTFAPFLAVAISFAIRSVLSTLRPTMQALAPKWTRARTWAEQIEPAPPVQNTTLLSIKQCQLQPDYLWTRGRQYRIGRPSTHH
jgi:hypothetical protein